MIHKIDKPEAPPPYQITRPKESKEDQHQSPNQREEQEMRYQKEQTGKDWDKFDRRKYPVRSFKVRKELINHLLYRSSYVHGGICTIIVDIVWHNGQLTYGALIPALRYEDFFSLKKFVAGEKLPEEFWARGDELEIGIQVVPQVDAQKTQILKVTRPHRGLNFSTAGWIIISAVVILLVIFLAIAVF